LKKNKKTLTKLIREFSIYKNEFVKNPIVIMFVNERFLLKGSNKASSSATLVQQRNKILPTVFKKLFHDFVRKTSNDVTYKDF